MSDGIDRADWSAQDHDAERLGQDLVDIASDEPTPPPQGAITDRSVAGYLKLWGQWMATKPNRLAGASVVLFAILIVIVMVTFNVAILGGGSDDSDAAADAAATAPVGEASGSGSEPLDESLPDEAAGADLDEAVALLASAAGVYQLSEASARRALEPHVHSFESAEGVIVVAPDGTLSGEYTYVYWDPFDDVLARVSADATIDPASMPTLVVTEAGLTFEGTVIQVFLIEPTGEPSYTNPGSATPFRGLVDPETGVLECIQVNDGVGAPPLEFLR